MIMKRVWAMPNKWTFKMKPIRELLNRYVKDGKGWIDPFSGMCSPAEFTNDLNPKMKAEYHMNAIDFIKKMNGFKFKGILFDPPYTLRQIKECYNSIGKENTDIKVNVQLYSSVKKAIAPKIKPGGYAIHFGYHSNGFGKNLGFKIIEILLIAHGGAHYDTIVTVEQKVNKTVGDFCL